MFSYIAKRTCEANFDLSGSSNMLFTMHIYSLKSFGEFGFNLIKMSRYIKFKIVEETDVIVQKTEY